MADQAETPPFPFAKLPVEIQKLITRHELAVAPNRMVPALLIALASDKDNGKSYYEYAREQYRKINYVVSSYNAKRFQAMKLKDVKLIRHLTLVTRQFIGDHPPFVNWSQPLHIGRSLAIACNRFETITVDMTSEESDSAHYSSPLVLQNPFLKWSMMASTSGVKEIIAVFNVSCRGSAMLEIAFATAMSDMGLLNPKVDGETHASTYGANIRILRWEKESGVSLRITR